MSPGMTAVRHALMCEVVIESEMTQHTLGALQELSLSRLPEPVLITEPLCSLLHAI